MALASEGNNSQIVKAPAKKTSFYLGCPDRDDEKSDDGKTPSVSKFKVMAKKIALANRVFPLTQRKISRISSGSQSEADTSRGYSARQSLPRENTYRTGPDSKLRPEETRKVVIEILKSRLGGEEYLALDCKKLCALLSDEIKASVRRSAGLDRHKLVCVVYIGQVLGQGVHVTSRCLWNAKFDAFSSATFQNDSLFAQASIFAVYLE